MVDELKILDLLYSCRYTWDHPYEGWTYKELYELDVDITEKLDKEFDKIRCLYFEILSGRETREQLDFMFTFRYNRLINLKVILEKKLKNSLDSLIILGEDCGALSAYERMFAGYKGVLSLMSIIINDSCIPLGKLVDEHALTYNYSFLNSDQISKWNEEYLKNVDKEKDFVLVDGMKIDLSHQDGYIAGVDYIPDFEKDKEIIQKQIHIENNGLTFSEFMHRVDLSLKRIKYKSIEERCFYEELKETLSCLQNSDENGIEEKILDFLIETNIEDLETYEFMKHRINKDLYCGDKDENSKYLIGFKERLLRMKKAPLYKKHNLSNVEGIVNCTQDMLVDFVEEKFTNHEGLFQDNKIPLTDAEKIKTNISVPNLGLLLRLLRDDKLIIGEDQKSLAIKIATFVSSLDSDNIGLKSLENEFKPKTLDPINYWRKKFGSYIEELDELEEKMKK